jgi:hypothetical protein
MENLAPEEGQKKAKKSAAMHTMGTAEWGTDSELIRHAKMTLGFIDLDPCSGPNWNQEIGASRIITKDQDCRIEPWIEGIPMLRSGSHLSADDMRKLSQVVLPPNDKGARQLHVFCNPAGDKYGELVAHCWRTITAYHRAGWIGAAVWIGFSVEQLARLQRVGAVASPLDYITIIPARRRSFMVAPGVAGTAPSHAAFLTLIGGDAEMQKRFMSNSALGQAITAIA